ncbi:cytochrome c oxidase assembly protein [Pyruvatibacter mobilis]|uniref:cytochrome c oxidase assembly protein n=1 Tax=Pyruvatibacter mobilis TaxID=1712261 RepID=UPI003BABC1F2
MTASTMNSTVQKREKQIVLACALIVGGMVGMAYAAVPLYDLFCRVTGYGGTTQASAEFSDVILDRVVTVRFDANTNRALNWQFKPQQVSTEINVGADGLAFYTAENLSDRPIVGTATYNVTPQKAGVYFAKVDCFCFTEQLLMPGEKIDMPVSFFVDPAIADDPQMDDVTTITLSYTFYEKANPTISIPETASVTQAAAANGS